MIHKTKLKIIQLHNWHRFEGGSETVVEDIVNILKCNEHEVILNIRDSRYLGKGIKGKVHAFYCGIYSHAGRRLVSKLLSQYKPDLVHIHELYPYFSPWVLLDCKNMGIPIVMTCHDFRLTCPIATHHRNSTVCKLCSVGKEYHCILGNCRSNIFESIGYALRSFVARDFKLFKNNVTHYITPTNFLKDWLINFGFNQNNLSIVPNMVSLPHSICDITKGKYIAYVGRLNKEKGIEVLLDASRRIKYPIRLAGDYTRISELAKTAPLNVKFLGKLNKQQLYHFYRNARFLIVPSLLLEVFGLVAAEAMSHGVPVIASNIGGLPEVVDDGVTGFLFKPGSVDDLVEKINILLENSNLCREMGQASRDKVIREYSEEVHYKKLMAIYEKSLTNKSKLQF